MSYTEQDRTQHYTGAIEKADCIVCLLGMSVSHGAGQDSSTTARLGDRWWSAGFYSVSVVVEGALEEEKEPVTAADLDKLVERVKAETAADHKQTAVYALWHEHAPQTADDDAEDLCIQYSTDHRPYWSSEEE